MPAQVELRLLSSSADVKLMNCCSELVKHFTYIIGCSIGPQILNGDCLSISLEERSGGNCLTVDFVVLIDLEIAHVQLLLMILITGLLEMSEIGRCIGYG